MKRRLDLANLSTCVLKFAEPRSGVVGKGKESSVLQIRAHACLNLQNRGGRWSAKSKKARFCQFEQVGGGQQGQRTEMGSGQPRAGRLSFVNSGTQMLELVERRVAGGWPRPGRLTGFGHSCA